MSDKNRLKELLLNAYWLIDCRLGDISTEDGSTATCEINQMIVTQNLFHEEFGEDPLNAKDVIDDYAASIESQLSTLQKRNDELEKKYNEERFYSDSLKDAAMKVLAGLDSSTEKPFKRGVAGLRILTSEPPAINKERDSE